MVKFDKLQTTDLVVVSFKDITSVSKWFPEEEIINFPASFCKACGWLISQDKENIRLFNLINGDGDKNVLVIPKGAITKIKIIKYERG